MATNREAAGAPVGLDEAQLRLRLAVLGTVSPMLAAVIDDYGDTFDRLVATCVPTVCDLLALELAEPGGAVTAAWGAAEDAGLRLPSAWSPVGPGLGPVAGVAQWPDGTGDAPGAAPDGAGAAREALQAVAEGVGAAAVAVAALSVGGLTLGWLVAAHGPARAAVERPDADILGDVAIRVATTIQRVNLYREMQAAALDVERGSRERRRLAGAAAGLAAAGTPRAVLRAGCVGACIVHEADGAAARWWFPNGREVSAGAGTADPGGLDAALQAALDAGGPVHGPEWIACPLPCSDPAHRGALAIFIPRQPYADEEAALLALASLVPMAFERAVGTELAAAQEARSQAVIDASPVALFTVRRDGSVDNANRAALDLLAGGTGGAGGAAGAEVTAAPGERTLPDDIGAAVRQLADEVRRSGASHSRPLSTERMELSVSAAPLPAGADLDDGTVVVAATDLTERRRAERALVRAQRLEAMGQIAGRVAHDFNNLLTLIMGYSDLLRRSLDGDDTGLQMLTQIDRAAKRAAALTGQMLGFTRRRVGTTALVDLNEVLGNLERVLAGVAGANVALTMTRPPAPVWVRGDAGDLEQVVVNLAINAVDAMAGSGALTVSLQTAAEPPAGRLGLAPGAYAVLTVADEGPGMNEAVLARCTEPFFTTKEQGRGSGLGLSTVAGLAADFGGLLDIDSAPGRGTRAVIWLPLQEARAEAPAGGSAAGPVAGEPVRVRVLLVEDEDDLRVLATRALTEAGADVWAESTAEAVLDQRDRWSDFDVLVTDVILPSLNGVELASRLRTARPDLPVLYVTGYANQALRQQGLVADARILRKPYTPGELRAALLAVAREAPRAQGTNR